MRLNRPQMAFLLTAAVFPAVAHGYVPLYSSTGNPLHWIDQIPATPDVIDIFYDFRSVNGYPNIISDAQKALAIQALGDWSAVTGGRIAFTQDVSASNEIIIIISVGDLAAVGGESAVGGTLGYTDMYNYPSGRIDEASIQIDQAETWDLVLGNGNPDIYSDDFYNTMIHEIGHALGLDHADVPRSNLMTTYYYGEKLGPSKDDIDGINFLYEGNAALHYNDITRNLASFTVQFDGHYNYYEGSPSTLYYYTDAGTTHIAGDTSVAEFSEFHMSGGIWNTATATIGSNILGPGVFNLSAGTFNASSNITLLAQSTATLSGGLLSLPSGTLTVSNSVTSPASFTMSGGLLTAGTLRVRTGGTFLQSGGTLTLGTINHSGGTVTLASTLSVNSINQSGGTLTLGGSQSFYDLSSLAMSGGRFILTSEATPLTKVLRTSAISIAGTGRLDLTTGKLIVQAANESDKATKLTTLRNLVNSGRAGGTWTGNGITSSTAAADSANYGVGIFDNALLGKTSFGGQSVDGHSLLVSVAHLGDANIDNIVDIVDLAIVANNWQQNRNTWSAGDLNYDDLVDIVDLAIVANNWQQSGDYGLSSGTPLGIFPDSIMPSSQSAMPLSSIPEPATLSILAVIVPCLLRRRKL